jgi:transmembrane sensor
MDPNCEHRISKAAADWYARLRAPGCSAADREAFEQWRDADPAHAAAYASALRVSAAVDELLARDPRIQALLDDALLFPQAGADVAEPVVAFDHAANAPRPSGTVSDAGRARRWKIPAALAASVLLAVGSVGVHRIQREAEPVVYETAGTGRSIILQDGSRLQLDVGTRLAVRYTPRRREITLEAGRALFDVAHDPARPFSVAASTFKTTALGTRFQVELRDRVAFVTLAEGTVAIDNEDATHVWQERLRPGEQLAIDVASAARNKQPIDPSVATSWSRGRLLFRDTPLAQAVDEINRYATKKVLLGDPSLANLPVGGNFIAGDSDLIVDALAAVLPLRVVNGGDKEIILVRRYEGGRP